MPGEVAGTGMGGRPEQSVRCSTRKRPSGIRISSRNRIATRDDRCVTGVILVAALSQVTSEGDHARRKPYQPRPYSRRHNL